MFDEDKGLYMIGGAAENSPTPVNESKPCWKLEGTYCLIASDKSEMCNTCEVYKSCINNRG